MERIPLNGRRERASGLLSVPSCRSGVFGPLILLFNPCRPFIFLLTDYWNSCIVTVRRVNAFVH